MKNPYITKVDNNELIGSTRHINSSLHGILIKKQIWKQK